MSEREIYRKHSITVPMHKEDKERVKKMAQSMGMTAAGFVRFVTMSYLNEKKVHA